MKRALITGILGQDGSYMADLLVSKGYDVWGIQQYYCDKPKHNIVIIKSDITNKDDVFDTINSIRPTEIYNFASISNVFNPWNDFDKVIAINGTAPCLFLDAIVKIDRNIKFFQASSCLTFGGDTSGLQNENTPPIPIYPYGVAKLFADNMVREYRRHYGLHCCSGIFFNHESPRRGSYFFSKKVVEAVVNIKRGKLEKLIVGDLSVKRDYGYAPDFVEAAHMMLNSTPTDYVIGTGNLISLEDFVRHCFEMVDLDYTKYIEIDSSLHNRDCNILRADITKISTELGWVPKHSVYDTISIMIKNQLEKE